MSRSSLVGKENGCWLDDRGVRSMSPGEVKNCHLSIPSILALGLTPAHIQWVKRTLSLGLKLQGRETDHSLQTSAEV
jgi:hypothetical protein